MISTKLALTVALATDIMFRRRWFRAIEVMMDTAVNYNWYGRKYELGYTEESRAGIIAILKEEIIAVKERDHLSYKAAVLKVIMPILETGTKYAKPGEIEAVAKPILEWRAKYNRRWEPLIPSA